MKRNVLLLILLIISEFSYSQDTITYYLTSGCILNRLKSIISPNSSPVEIDFNFSYDTLRITGKIRANCGSAHIAIIHKTLDTLFITTLDTGRMTLCDCFYNFGIKVKSAPTDTIVKFNGKTYNSKGLYNSIKRLEDDSRFINIYPNPTKDYFIVKTQSGVQIFKISILDDSGKLLRTIITENMGIDMVGLKAGMYFIDFEIQGQTHIVRKVMKK